VTGACEKCGASGRVYRVKRLDLTSVCRACGDAAIEANPPTKAESQRIRRNSRRRERDQAMRDLGLVKTPYGWE
jgi:hypothetical protein